jgi:hypothetical protein
MTDDELTERLAPFPEDGPQPIQVLEVHFGLPVTLTQAQYDRFNGLIEEIVKEPYNQPRNGVHWLSGGGSRPNFSAIDAALLGMSAGPDFVPDGEEPVFDDSVYQLITTARGFVNDRERLRVEKERAIFDTCPDCQEPRYLTPSGPACKNGHGG